MNTLTDNKKENPSDCIAPLFKASVYCGVIKKGIGCYIRLIKSRLLCKGCEKCDWGVEEHINEIDTREINIININKAQDGKFYHLLVVNKQYDWETGYCDDFDLELREYKIEDR